MIFTTVIDYCKSNGIQGMAFSPNATGRLFNHPLSNEIAAKYGVTIPQLDVRYDLQLGVLCRGASSRPISKKTRSWTF